MAGSMAKGSKNLVLEICYCLCIVFQYVFQILNPVLMFATSVAGTVIFILLILTNKKNLRPVAWVFVLYPILIAPVLLFAYVMAVWSRNGFAP